MGFFCRYYTPTGPAVPSQTLSVQSHRALKSAYCLRDMCLLVTGRFVTAGLIPAVSLQSLFPEDRVFPHCGYRPTQPLVSLGVRRRRTSGIEIQMALRGMKGWWKSWAAQPDPWLRMQDPCMHSQHDRAPVGTSYMPPPRSDPPPAGWVFAGCAGSAHPKKV